MTVSSTTSSTSGAAGSGTASGQSVISALGAGSGIDVQSLARNLVNAVKAPQQALIDKAIQKDQARISGYGYLNAAIGNLKDAFASLADYSGLASASVQSSSSTAVTATATGAAAPVSHSIDVLTLATAQTSISAGFSSASGSVLNGGTAFTITINGTAISVATPSLDYLATKINAVTGTTGVSAQVIDTGSGTTPYRILLSARSSGTDGAFTVTTDDGSGASVDGLALADTVTDTSDPEGILTEATDAHFRVDGLDLYRSSNSIGDAIPGLNLQLAGLTSDDGTAASSTAVTLQVSLDTSGLGKKLQALVSAYNDVQTVLNVTGDAKSTVANGGGTLANDSIVSQLRSSLVSLVTADSEVTSNDVSALRQLGVSLEQDGTLSFKADKLAALVASTSFSDVALMLTNGEDNSADIAYQTDTGHGLAADTAMALRDLIAPDGIISIANQSATDDVKDQNTRTSDLAARMQLLLDRYIQQFAAMDALVGQMTSTRSWLKSQFDAMNGNKTG